MMFNEIQSGIDKYLSGFKCQQNCDGVVFKDESSNKLKCEKCGWILEGAMQLMKEANEKFSQGEQLAKQGNILFSLS